jgi:hypothetical protein
MDSGTPSRERWCERRLPLRDQRVGCDLAALYCVLQTVSETGVGWLGALWEKTRSDSASE